MVIPSCLSLQHSTTGGVGVWACGRVRVWGGWGLLSRHIISVLYTHSCLQLFEQRDLPKHSVGIWSIQNDEDDPTNADERGRYPDVHTCLPINRLCGIFGRFPLHSVPRGGPAFRVLSPSTTESQRRASTRIAALLQRIFWLHVQEKNVSMFSATTRRRANGDVFMLFCRMKKVQ